jgi:hypothetical protein
MRGTYRLAVSSLALEAENWDAVEYLILYRADDLDP